MRYKYVPYQYTEYQYVLLCHNVEQLKYRFMVSTNDMNDFMIKAILGDGNIARTNSSVFLLSTSYNN